MRLVLVLALLAFGCGRRPGPDAGADAADERPTEPGLVLVPAEQELVAEDGAMPTATLRAILVHEDGRAETITPEQVVVGDDRILARSDGPLTFAATGRAGGRVEVIVRHRDGALGELMARATIHVRVVATLPLGPGVPASVPERFTTLPEREDPFEAAALEYPLEGARMPNNVAPPVVQWYPRGGVGDAYRVVVSSEHAEVSAFTYDDGLRFRSSHPIDPVAWRLIADSTRGDVARLRVDRIPAGGSAIVRGPPVTIWLSEDGVFGTVYYWQVRVDPQASDVLRLDAASGERRSVFALEPGRCVGCHALSGDGRRMAATMDGRALRWVTSLVDLASTPPSEVTPAIEPGYHFLAFSPDGRRALASVPRGATGNDSVLGLLDASTLALVPASGLPDGSAGYPAWSPDGTRVAWMDGGTDGARGTTLATRIAVADVLGADVFGAARVLHDGAALEASLEGGATDSRPTWSPDSAFLAFAHGTSSISAPQDGVGPSRAGLYLVPAAGGEPIRLDRGMGREGPVDAFWPVFSPFVTEEQDGTRHFWLAFYSRADYGNALEGTEGTGRRQLWVMAIDPVRALAGEDPSYPPYWLPGQDARADDIAALWAPTACRARGEPCSASSECCSGECAAADPAMPDVLTCQPPSVCREAGESCDQASDCCSGICELGVCDYESPF